MTLEEFIKKYNGTQVEVTGSTNAKFQCVDLANAYIRDVLDLPIIKWTNAQDFPQYCLPPSYEYILNSPTGFPLKGDIVIWSSKDNVGHIAICIEDGNTKNFKSFDQNWSKPLYCTLETHIYTGSNHQVAGWLRPKNVIIPEMTDVISELIKANGLVEGDIRWLIDLKTNQTVPNLEKKVNELESSIKDLGEQINIINAKLGENEKDLVSCQKELKIANQTISNISAELETANGEKSQYKKWYEAKCDELKKIDKMTAYQHIIYGIKLLINKKQ